MEATNTKRNNRKGRKKRPASTQHQHHPWDEVSLPGAGSSPSEQPTILVINQVNGETTRQEIKLETAESERQQSHPIEELEVPPTDDNQSSEQSTDTIDKPTIVIAPATPTPSPRQEPDFSEVKVVHEIESHLIENAHSYQLPASGVGINELPPVKDELTTGSSKVETDSNVRSVIEVEPAGVKLKQAVESPGTIHQIAEVEEKAQAVREQSLKEQAVKQAGVRETIADEQSSKEVTVEVNGKSETELLVSEKQADETANVLEEALVRETAEDLVNQIESAVIATLSKATSKEDVAELLAKAVKTTGVVEKTEQTALSDKVDVQLTELTSILKAKPQVELQLPQAESSNGSEVSSTPKTVNSNELKIVEVPTPKTALEEEQRKLFIDSLPQIEQDQAAAATDATRLSADCKREYYQSLKKYLLQSQQDKPPVPAQTYRWEDLKRAKERGGYPWTHLYKRPLGPDEEPEIVLLLRKSQELRFKSESPKSLKKVRYDEQVLVKETERYIQDLTDDEDIDLVHDEDDISAHNPKTEDDDSLRGDCISCVSDSVLAVGGHSKPRKTFRLTNIRNIIKRRRSGRTHEDAQSLPGTSANTSRHSSAHDLAGAPPPGPLVPQVVKNSERKPPIPIMKKLKSYADRQKKRLNIRRITLKKDEKIVLGDEPKILRLKSSPKCDRGEIPHFIEKQDSDEILEIVEYDESPSRKRNKQELERIEDNEERPSTSGISSGIVQPDEVIELPREVIKEAEEVEVKESPSVVETETADDEAAPPKKAPRLRREHVYEEIAQTPLPAAQSGEQLTDILAFTGVENLKKSLIRQDNIALQDIETANKSIPLDRMGSSEEEQVAHAAAVAAAAAEGKNTLLAPISSIDSASSDEARQTQLSPVAEESDVASTGGEAAASAASVAMDITTNEQLELKPSIKKEPSPAPSDKKVTFSHVEDEAEPHREDIELPEELLEAAAEQRKLKQER